MESWDKVGVRVGVEGVGSRLIGTIKKVYSIKDSPHESLHVPPSSIGRSLISKRSLSGGSSIRRN